MKLAYSTYLLFSVFIVFFVDQASKKWADSQGWIVLNPGVSFGFLSNGSPVVHVFVVASVLCGTWAILRSQKLPAWWWGALGGAAVSNLFDRSMYHAVQDWLPLPYTSITNNLADWVICLCLVWLCVKEYRTIRS